jgi:hypothetical protein
VDQRNPYAPPRAQVDQVKYGNCTRDGDTVIVQIGSDLPPRCIKCNAPVKGRIKKIKLYWHSPWLYLLIFINILIYAIVALIARSTVEVSPGLCKDHSAKRLRGIFIFVGLGGGACVTAIGLLEVGQSELAIIFFFLAIILLIAGALVSRKVYAKKITKEYVRLGGCKEPFLASLIKDDVSTSRLG